MYDSAMEYIARLPPMRNEFQLVTIPHMPPTIRTFDIILLLNAFAMASAVTRPDPSMDAATSDEFMT